MMEMPVTAKANAVIMALPREEAILSYFIHVPKVRCTVKSVGITMCDVVKMVESDGKLDHSFSVSIRENAEVKVLLLRWAMCCRRGSHSRNWSMALIFGNTRIDGVDWEGNVHDHRGHDCMGWHRHMWDVSKECCKMKKECIPDFDEVADLQSFVVQGCKVLGMELGKEVQRREQSSLSFN